jgi:hypothetical protein
MAKAVLTKDLRDRLRSAIEVQIKYLETDPDLTSKERIEYITRLLPYVVGKISAAKVEDDVKDFDPINDLI